MRQITLYLLILSVATSAWANPITPPECINKTTAASAFFTGIDTDNDGINDNIDLDDDNDGILDTEECTNITMIPIANIATGSTAVGTLDPFWDVQWLGVPTDNRYAVPNSNAMQDAYVVGELVGAWANPVPGANWISYDFSSLVAPNAPGNHKDADEDGNFNEGSGANPIVGSTGDWVLLRFINSNVQVPAGCDPGVISLDLSLSQDNKISDILINGVSNGPSPGTAFNRVSTITLDKGWQNGANTIEIFVESGPGQVGFFLTEGSTACADCKDTDNDGIPDYVDLDSDNDGITDIIEAGGVDIDNDGIVDDNTDTDGDGLADTFDADNGGTAIANTDSDGDGIANAIDIDSDNDGIVDFIEGQASTGFLMPSGMDADGDGIDDNFDSTVGFGGALIDPEDTDNDGLNDYLDFDSDDDGETDAVEGNDSDNDGTADSSSPNDTGVFTGMDSDGDGLDDGYDNDDSNHNPTNATTAADAPENDATDSDMDWRDNAANIAGFVWDDTNADGMQDAGEAGIGGVTVEVKNAAGDAVIATGTTDADGNFLFADFDPMGATSYYLEFTYPSGYSVTSAPDQGGNDRMDSDADVTTNRTAPFSVDNSNPAPFFGAGFQSAPLPVEMLGIGFRGECDAELFWNVAQEIGVSTYDVEYSQTGVTWFKASNVSARNNSEYATEVDRSGYYRIVSVDNDGITSTSDIVFREACSTSGVKLYPNPAPPEANVTLSGLTPGGVITVVHVDGRLIREINADADQLDLSLNGLVPGVYIIQHGADAMQLIVR